MLNKFNVPAYGGIKIGGPLAAKAATVAHAEKLNALGACSFCFVIRGSWSLR